MNDKKLWESCYRDDILHFFQFESGVGSQTIKSVRPTNPIEMANCNSAMRLVAPEKGGETPTERIIRFKRHPEQLSEEMKSYGLSIEEQHVLEKYYLPANGMPANQEDMMLILMDNNICGFSLAEANAAKKVCAKKILDQIEPLHKKVLERAKSYNLGRYVWETAIRPQMSYSFSIVHALSYSFVGLQTVYLATYFPPVYWNTACLRVDSGLDEDASSNYNKIAKAVGDISNKGIKVSLIDINKSGYMFEPDEENNQILYGLKALNGVGGDIIQEIVANRPYSSWQDFAEKVKPNKTVMVSLIKSGAFDQFGERKEIMREYLWSVCEPKKRITLQNFNSLIEKNLVPQELTFQKRLFRFNKMLKTKCHLDGYYVLRNDNYYKFYTDYFDLDLLEPSGEKLAIKDETWKKIYSKQMEPAKKYFKEHQQEMLDKLNATLFQEMWDKYAGGTYSSWEMDSLGMYYHGHELKNFDYDRYEIQEFNDLPQDPIVDYTFKRNGLELPVYKTCRIAGTVIAKDDMHSSISILTVGSGVVTVKMNRDYFAKYNRRISEVMRDGTKKVREPGFFQKGTLVVLNGIRRNDTFLVKTYKRSKYHGICKITELHSDGSAEMQWQRYGEEEE